MLTRDKNAKTLLVVRTWSTERMQDSNKNAKDIAGISIVPMDYGHLLQGCQIHVRNYKAFSNAFLLRDAMQARYNIVLCPSVRLSVYTTTLVQQLIRYGWYGQSLQYKPNNTIQYLHALETDWVARYSRVASVLESGAEGPGFNAQPRHWRV